jgi:hypothetical protein
MADRIYKIESLGRQLGIGAAGSRYALLSAVVKSNGPNAPYCLPNELICCKLGRFLGLPVPPVGMVAQPGGSPVFASLDFNITGNALPPVDVARCVHLLPWLSAGLLLFDIWVANLDRHPANFSVDFLSSPPAMNVFDHSHALLGYNSGAAVARLTALRDRLGVSWKTGDPIASGRHRHCLLDAVKTDDHFAAWHDRIKATPDFYIKDKCEAAISCGASREEADAAIGFLLHRRDTLLSIVGNNRTEFTAINTWRLFP